MEEIWKQIVGADETFQVSNIGNVKRNDSYYIQPLYDNMRVLLRGSIKRLFVDRQGYSTTALRINNKQKTYFVHRLVAEAFIPNPDNKPFINHIDGNPSNNNVENLEWCTQKENIRHAVKIGRWNAAKGEYAAKAKLTTKDVLQIRTLRGMGLTLCAIAKKYNITNENVSAIANRKTWRHI